jgi:hypothetical protein
MGLNFDLATVAGMAGLGGSAVAAIAAGIFFKGLIMRVLAQVIVTTVLSFIGFVALFNMLGFQIIPPTQIAGVKLPGAESFSVQSVPSGAAAPAPVQQGYVIKSPWSK